MSLPLLISPFPPIAAGGLLLLGILTLYLPSIAFSTSPIETPSDIILRFFSISSNITSCNRYYIPSDKGVVISIKKVKTSFKAI